MGVFLNSIFGQMLRDSQHLKQQTEGRKMIAQRLGISGAWQPEMVNCPSFVCAHCQFPHILRQTLLGCRACAAPYLTSEVMSLSKNGRLTCVTCAADQNISEMPFCCTNCRCIQGVPTQLDWRKTFTRFPAWRSYAGSAASIVIGFLIMLVFFAMSRTANSTHADDFVAMGIVLGSIPVVIGGIVLVALMLRKKVPAELMLSCGGFGMLTATGEERWFSWHDIRGLDARQMSSRRSLVINTSSPAQPDSTASGWIVHTAQEPLFFDHRFQKAEEFARQLRMRAPAAPLVDLPPMVRPKVWVTLLILLGIVTFAVLSALFSKH